eukprot:CAMPEP_0172585404 /NCGR_PEP_ID=MMETSP1068-20121228/4830_1 /TAXON_ID=35684 /ORGANISM="Pseudopedinella elastica, Strain CCMP716" /LENGTH=61 /DNA_ID=CAMNT_0013379851 /DNA_START=32 /DNA_END=214 /DNA_ORIENTATION=-
MGGGSFSEAVDGRICFVETRERANDGGHSPRAFGLEWVRARELAQGRGTSSWTLLSGVDNY